VGQIIYYQVVGAVNIIKIVIDVDQLLLNWKVKIKSAQYAAIIKKIIVHMSL